MKTNIETRPGFPRNCLAALFLTFLFYGCDNQHEAAEQVYLNGQFWTADPAQPTAQALAIRGDQLVAVGSNEDIQAWVGAATRVIDLQQQRVVPGFNDAHWHFAPGSMEAMAGAGNLEELQRRLALLAHTSQDSEWIFDGGWAYADFPDRVPHRDYLDAIVPDRPVYLIGRDGHMALANSEALRRAGIDRNTPDPKQGHILHDAAGEPTGELNGKAVQRVIELIPPPSPAKLLKRFQAIQDEAASYGVTSVQNLGELQGPELAVIVQLLETQGLKLRIYSVATLRNSSDQQIQHYQELKQKYAGPMFKFGGAKGILDGTIDASTAFMLEPLTNGQAGLSYWDSNELNVAVARFDAAGFQVMLHAVGDAAIKQAIDAFANASQVNGAAGRRYRIEHLDIPSARDLERMKTLGVIASSQPNFAYPDATNLGNYALLLGPERMQRAQAYRSIDDAGLVQAFASDFPVSSMNVLIALHTALTRQNLQREPPGGWYPQQRIGIEAALRHFTIDGAYASFDEQIKGSLTVGKLADFLVVSRDILTADKDPAILLEARVLLTVMGGRVTFESPQAGL